MVAASRDGAVRALKNLVIITQQELQAAKMVAYQSDPLLWYTDRWGGSIRDIKWSDYPEYDGHEWDGTPDPFLRAVQALRDGRDVGIEAATGVGKTYLAARIAFWFLDVFPGSAVITTAPTKEQLLQVLWKEVGASYNRFRKLHPESEIITGEVRVNKNLDYKNDEDGNIMDYANRMTSKVGRKRTGEDSSVSFQGIHNEFQLFILDEAAALENSVFNAIKNTNTFKSPGAKNLMLALGNPDSVTDALHTFCELASVEAIRISAYDHPNVVTGTPIIKGAVDRESLTIRKEEYGADSNLFKSRGRGISPEQSITSLIMMKWVMQCWMDHKTYKELGPIKPDGWSYNAAGVDVANSVNGDAGCVAYGQGNILVKLIEFSCPHASDLADNLISDKTLLQVEGKHVYDIFRLSDYKINPENVGVDGVGIGVATVQRFEGLGYSVRSLSGGRDEEAIPIDSLEKLLYDFPSLRAQMYWQARLDLMNRRCAIGFSDMSLLMRLAKELTMPTYKVSDKAIVIEKKEDIKLRMGGKSPNLADAFVYWNWVRRYRGRPKEEMPMLFGDAAPAPTNPYNVQPDLNHDGFVGI